MIRGKQALYCSRGLFHPSIFARRRLRRLLAREIGLEMRAVSPLGIPRTPAGSEARLLILYIHHKKRHPAIEDVLLDYVKSGGRILAIHSTSASFKGSDRFFELLGGCFAGHGPVRRFTVTSVEAVSGAGIGPFSVTDELYLHRTAPGIRVLYGTDTSRGIEPVAWVRSGDDDARVEGMVGYCSLGHRSRVFTNPSVKALLEELIEILVSHDPRGVDG